MAPQTLAILLVGILQAGQAIIMALGLSALNDLRARIARLESLQMRRREDY